MLWRKSNGAHRVLELEGSTRDGSECLDTDTEMAPRFIQQHLFSPLLCSSLSQIHLFLLLTLTRNINNYYGYLRLSYGDCMRIVLYDICERCRFPKGEITCVI